MLTMAFKTVILLVGVAMAAHPAARVHSNSSGIATQNFIQKVNHTADGGSATFKQRYQLNTRYFEPGGPILFLQSAEAGMPSINSSDLMDYAPKLKALVAILEHRYFGDFHGGSYPAKYDPMNISSGVFNSLTLDNVLQDGVDFVNWIKKTVSGAAESPVIYSGCEYQPHLSIRGSTMN